MHNVYQMRKESCVKFEAQPHLFVKPRSIPNWDYPDMVKEAVTKALVDAKLQYKDIEQAVVSYLYGGTCCGQRALYEIGLTGIPIFNVNNACASGSSGVYLCKQILESGSADVVMAVGFEKMAPGSLEAMQGNMDERAQPVEKHIEVMAETYGLFPAPITAQINSQFQKAYTLEEVLNARKIYDFMGLLECSPTSDGAAAAVLCSERYLLQHPELRSQAVEILGMHMIGFDMIRKISADLYRRTGINPEDVQVIELHDCFAPNELITYEALGLCPIGKGGEIVDRRDNTYGGKWVINPSGGLISKGHPIGATGVAQVVELSTQLRGLAGRRQVPNCMVAVQHNIGIGGAGVVAMYRLADGAATRATVNDVVKPSAQTRFASDVIFEEVKDRVAEEKDLVKALNSSFRITITGGPNGGVKKWTIDCKSDPPFVGERVGDVDIEIIVSDSDFIQLASGKLKPDQAFMQGRMKLKGNVAKAMRIRSLLDPKLLKAKL
ncbi:unnamed protein product [Toxocara canis]|uniref:Sterol carrier protein 2 n=1 Tax=Toxocara canis TaxID=6265 RepID=A0A183V3T0_TOXCA|nr:unnamed protein product [Toxocara canis]